ncbi:MAG: hypothetical protein QOJ64_3777 [Acidobacteriota bacterium]|nr:hypothetical protein [Acidobacteriota bacterium]
MRDEEKRGRLSSTSLTSSTSAFIPHPSSLVVVWSITALLTLAFVSLIVIAPMALAHGHNSAAFVLYKSFEKFCHQIPERSFYVDGHPLAVCARCTGIYFGFAAGVLFYPVVRSLAQSYPAPARRWLLIALAPAVLDFALDYLGIWQNTRLTRSLSGALLGSVVAFYVVPALLDMIRMSPGWSRSRETKYEQEV